MIDLPARREVVNHATVNPFEGVITPEVITNILKKQVEKAQDGDTASASLVLKVAMAMNGKGSSKGRNPETPKQHPPTVALVAAQLRASPLNLNQIAARLCCDADEVREILHDSNRFAVNGRGLWSLAPVAALPDV